MDGRANKVSLIEAQRNHQDFGVPATSTAGGSSAPGGGRTARSGLAPDRPRTGFLRGLGNRGPGPMAVGPLRALCWWLPTYWRRDQPVS
ncbi:hypothetical protein [Streptomyces mooreae]|uniref:hypothetical protein n=1 Tax=Streptomyces mooreae TaxID=3075523 RepID=UPI00374E0E69